MVSITARYDNIYPLCCLENGKTGLVMDGDLFFRPPALWITLRCHVAINHKHITSFGGKSATWLMLLPCSPAFLYLNI